MKKLLFFLFLFISFLGTTQEMKISGTVQDTSMYLPLYNAKTYVVRLSDSLVYESKTTDRAGYFEYHLPIDNYKMVVSYRSYDDREFIFAGSEDNDEFDLGIIPLSLEGTYFEDVVIYAYKDPVYYHGDTLVYIADSFPTKENAVVEDMLKRMPGITVESDGSITSNGKKVNKVYVDGDEFFGSDPTVATKNLASKSIDRVKIYEEDDEDDPFSDEKVQILDLRLKDDAKKGWFAKANGASDFQQFHEGQLLFNRFREKQKVFAFGIGSNTLNSSISQEDASQLGMGRGMTGSTGGGGGYPTTFQGGVFFSQNVSDRFKFDGNYSFSDNRVEKEVNKATQYIMDDTTYFSDENTLQNTMNQSHNLNMNFSIQLDSTQSLRISPRISYSRSKNDNSVIKEYLDENSSFTRRATNENESMSDAYRLSTNINYRKQFAKKGRSLSLRDNISYNKNQSDKHLFYEDYFYLTQLTDNEIRQQKENESANFTNTFSANYMEPLDDQWSLIFEYELYNNQNDRRQNSFDFDGEEYSVLDSLTSDEFSTTKLQNRAGVSVNFRTSKHTVRLGARARNILVRNDNLFTEDVIRQNETNVLPYLNYRYRISQNSSLSARVNTNSGLPSIDYLSPVRDNSNPNAVMVGNEHLKSSYNTNANVNYMIFRPISGINFRVGASARYTFNDFARSVEYDEIGRSVSKYENINTFNTVSANTGATFPVFNRVLTISPQFRYANSNQNSIIDGKNNLTNTHNFSPSVRLMVLTDFLEVTSSVQLTEQNGKNSNNENLNISNTIWNFNNEIKIFLPWKIDLIAKGNYYNYSNMSQGYDKEFFVLNAAVEKRLGRYNEWTIGVEGYDLLNQNTQVNRTFNINTIVDTNNDIISRYFLLRVTYTFNSTFRITKNKENEK